MNDSKYAGFHLKIPLLIHPHPIPPLEGEGNFLSLRERIKVRVGIFIIISRH